MHPRIIKTLSLILLLPLLAACAGTHKTSTEAQAVEIDPYESTNRKIHDFNDRVDQYVLKPVATFYADLTPNFMQTGVTNFFSNIGYLNVVVNSSLQGKFDDGMSDLFRFVFNSTLGLAGFIDVATPMGIPAHKEDLGQTFAVWGSDQGAYLTLPLFGPNTVRDTPDLVSSLLLNPITYLASTISLPATALNIINRRAALLEAKSLMEEAAIDPYSFTREAYLQQRNYLIHDGNPPDQAGDDIFSEEFFEE